MGLGPIYTPPSSGGLATAGLPAVVYVSPTGDDTTGQRGNQGRPFATIAAALAASSADDVIELAPGTYTENVAWTERRSLRGAGSRASFIVGTFTLTAPANDTTQNINIQDVNISGAGALNFAAKTGGDVLVEIRDCILGSAWTFTRATDGANFLAMYNTRCRSTITATWGSVRAIGCEFGNFTFNANAGSEDVYLEACIIPTVTLNGAGSTFKMAGCITTAALTLTDAFGGTLTTTGCDILAATITINSGTWHEYGCTFTQANVAGASSHKRVSYQRIARATYPAAPAVTTVTLPIALGATTYVVCVETNTQNGGAAYNVLITNKTGTGFDVTTTSPDTEDLTLGVFYRA